MAAKTTTVSFFLAFFLGGVAQSQCEVDELLGADTEPFDNFARSISVDGDFVIVGAIHEDANGQNSGAAYIFRHDGMQWIQDVKVTASDGGPLDEFGFSVSTSRGFAVVGAIGGSDDAGAAYVYRREGKDWVEDAILTASDGEEDDHFGESVAISGDVIVVGSHRDGGTTVNFGAAYIYRRNGSQWIEEAKLTARTPELQANFGKRVAIQGDVAIMTSPSHDSGRGRAHIFERKGDTWVLSTILLSPDPQPVAVFGSGVAIHGDCIVIGAFEHNVVTADEGAAFVFRRVESDWVLEAQLTANDPEVLAFFGEAVALHGNTIMVGAPHANQGAQETGAAYLFQKLGSAWTQTAKIVPEGSAGGDRVGRAVGVSETFLMVGATEHDRVGLDSGIAYVLTQDDCFLRGDCNGDGLVLAFVDAIFLLEYGFVDGDPPPCSDAADVNDDGTLHALVDALYLLQFGFLQGSPPPVPFQKCGADPTSDTLTCLIASMCP